MRILAALGVTAIVIVVVQDLSGKSDASRFAREERFKVVFGDQPTVGVENLCHQVSSGEYFLPGHLWVTKTSGGRGRTAMRSCATRGYTGNLPEPLTVPVAGARPERAACLVIIR